MNYRRLGKTELKVSILGLGCGRLGSVTQVGGDRAALRLVGSALDAGINFFDTADIYGQGASERLLAKALKGRRDQVVIATKAGFCLRSLGWIALRIKPLLRRFIRLRPGLAHSVQKVRATQQKQEFSAAYLQRSIEASLRRLQMDALDLFLLHSPPTETLRRGEVFQALERFKAEGKIRHFGVSCRTAADAKLCLDQPGLGVLQVELNPFTSQAIEEVLPAARTRDIAVMARQALAGGLLLRAPSEVCPEDCAGRESGFEEIRSRMETLETLARETGASRSQLAVQFLLELDAVSSVLIGTTRKDHLQEHLAALESPALPPGILARLRELPHVGAGPGGRAF